jgi:hypothetical protein
LHEPDFCYRIAPDSYVEYPMNPRGSQIVYLRSDCLLYVAVRRQDPTLCGEVKPAKAPFFDGSFYTAENCRKLAEEGTNDRSQVVGGKMELFMRMLGYVEPDGHLAVHDYVPHYIKEIKTVEFQRRAKQLPNFSEGDAAARQQLLALAPQCDTPSSTVRLCQLAECAMQRDIAAKNECVERLAAQYHAARPH